MTLPLEPSGHVAGAICALAKLSVLRPVEDGTAALRFGGFASESKIDFRAMTQILTA
jgi:hypothetical protein